MQQKKNEPDSSSPSSRRLEHPSTYFVQDRSNVDELIRLSIQDQMTTAMMGGVLSEQDDPTRFRRVLDVGCGTGGWLIELAKQYPMIQRLVGVDISSKMLEYARQQVTEQGVGDRVEFQVMDAIRLLEFPSNSFDLVNHRLAVSWLRKWDWINVLREYRRVCAPGGVIRLTEVECTSETSSPALMRLNELTWMTFYQAGNYFAPACDG